MITYLKLGADATFNKKQAKFVAPQDSRQNMVTIGAMELSSFATIIICRNREL